MPPVYQNRGPLVSDLPARAPQNFIMRWDLAVTAGLNAVEGVQNIKLKHANHALRVKQIEAQEAATRVQAKAVDARARYFEKQMARVERLERESDEYDAFAAQYGPKFKELAETQDGAGMYDFMVGNVWTNRNSTIRDNFSQMYEAFKEKKFDDGTGNLVTGGHVIARDLAGRGLETLEPWDIMDAARAKFEEDEYAAGGDPQTIEARRKSRRGQARLEMEETMRALKVAQDTADDRSLAEQAGVMLDLMEKDLKATRLEIETGKADWDLMTLGTQNNIRFQAMVNLQDTTAAQRDIARTKRVFTGMLYDNVMEEAGYTRRFEEIDEEMDKIRRTDPKGGYAEIQKLEAEKDTLKARAKSNAAVVRGITAAIASDDAMLPAYLIKPGTPPPNLMRQGRVPTAGRATPPPRTPLGYRPVVRARGSIVDLYSGVQDYESQEE